VHAVLTDKKVHAVLTDKKVHAVFYQVGFILILYGEDK
jgi:hypothetical protein